MITKEAIEKLDFNKGDGLLPAIVCHYRTRQVLMLGYVNQDSLLQTVAGGKVTFYSRSRKALWTKGETSGNFLYCKKILVDCDADAILLYAEPAGATCHTGTYTCFAEEKVESVDFLQQLNALIVNRKKLLPEDSYTTKLFRRGENRIIQKVGEEAVETVIAAKNNDREELINETSDLLFHLLVLLAEKNIPLVDVVKNLEGRHKAE